MKDKELLDEYNFTFKKKFGQNFLKDQNILDKIVNKSEVDKDTLVIEIGVGAAALTKTVAPNAYKVLGYEIDTTLKPILEDKLKEYNNIDIIYDDFLNRNVNEDIKKYNYKKLYIIANLPYYITTPIITKLIDDNVNVDKMVVMVQKEVGDRFNAKPDTKNYNSLTVFLNYYFNINKLMDVSRKCFVPEPNVDSVIIELKRKETKYDEKNEKIFFKLVRDAFTHKRKNLRNNLKGYDLEKIENVLKEYNLDLNVRAEHLTIDQFINISNEL